MARRKAQKLIVRKRKKRYSPRAEQKQQEENDATVREAAKVERRIALEAANSKVNAPVIPKQQEIVGAKAGQDPDVGLTYERQELPEASPYLGSSLDGFHDN